MNGGSSVVVGDDIIKRSHSHVDGGEGGGGSAQVLVATYVGGKLSSSSLDGMRCRRGRGAARTVLVVGAGIGAAEAAAGSDTG